MPVRAFAGALSPYSGTPASIPGTIQAEQFDNGGEGVAYHDTTAGNAGGQYRTTDVDIQATSGGYNVGWIAAGEWLNYTVNVASAGSYTVQLRVASPYGASLHLGFNTASNVWKTVSIPATGGWQAWTTVSVPVTLGAGTQQMTLLADTGGYNVDYVTVTGSSTGGTVSSPSTLTPYSGTPLSIPGTIQAEQFDNGGEGVAYHDTTTGNAGGQYRTTDVDIEGTSGGGYNVGWIAAGEWLNYTVNVSAAGNYAVSVRVASPNGASMHLGFNAASNVWQSISIPATGAWQTWTTVSVPVTLGAGTQQMTLLADTGGYNVDYVAVSGGTTPSTTSTVSVTLTAPTNGARYSAPATITVSASALTSSGTIGKVEFFNGAALIGTATTAPYGGTWSNVPFGTYSLVAKATNSSGTTATSAPVSVSVASPSTTPPASGGLLQPGNLVYQGSFRVPDILVPGKDRGFDYGGTAPAFNAAHNSLFLVSHMYDQLTAEISIPALGTGPASGLPMATALHGFMDATGGKLHAVASDPSTTVYIGGQFVTGLQLDVSAYTYYGGSPTSSHFSRSTNLDSGGVIGPVSVGPLGASFYSGYMGAIPSEWQSAFGGPALTGDCCLSVISRTSYGPAAFAFDPVTLGGAAPLVYYDSNHTTLGNWGDPGANPYFNGTTQITGIVFPEGSSSVLFFGTHGLGDYCYGEAAACGDPEGTSKGDHAYPYVYYVWAYDAHDLAAVHAGGKQPWEVKPYAVWELNLPTPPNHNGHHLGGATYDAATGRIFVSQQFGDGDKPVIHVFKVQ